MKENIPALIEELGERLYADFLRMRRWRLFHRLVGIGFSLVLIMVPATLAVGLQSSDTLSGKICLLFVTVVGGINAAFRPFLHSAQRRSDMNASRRLFDSYRCAVIRAGANESELLNVYEQYSEQFCSIYSNRGVALVDGVAAREAECHKSEVLSDATTRH